MLSYLSNYTCDKNQTASATINEIEHTCASATLRPMDNYILSSQIVVPYAPVFQAIAV